jgi:hypothetical protein
MAVSHGSRVTALTTLGIVASALIVPLLWQVAQWSGRHIPQDDVQGDYALGFAWALALGVSIGFWPVPLSHRKALLHLWIAKCVVALGLMLFSEWYYEMDAFDYYRNARDGRFGWEDLGWGAGTQIITLLVRLHIFVLPSYHAAKISFSMAGLVAVYLVYLAASVTMGATPSNPRKRERLSLLYVLALCPSVLFWSSILGKEPVVLLGIAAYILGVARTYRRRNASGLPLAIAGVLLASCIRPWLAAILLLPLAVFAVFGLRRTGTRVLVILMAVGALRASAAVSSSRLGLKSGDDALTSATKLNASFSNGGSAQKSGMEDSSLETVVGFAPLGMFAALFRPLPGEVNNIFGVAAGLENAVLLFFALRAVWRTPARELRDPFLLWAIVLLLVWAGGYGFISSANVGSGVRYRLQVMPLFVWLLVHLSRQRAPSPASGLAPRHVPLLLGGRLAGGRR